MTANLIHRLTKIATPIKLLAFLGAIASPTMAQDAPSDFFEPCTIENRVDADSPVRAWCGNISVQTNSSDAKSDLIELPILYVPALNPSNEPPIFRLGGGPGASNIFTRPREWHYREHDLIMVGYRGADGSPMLNCPNIHRGQLGNGIDLVSDASKKLFADEVTACVGELQQAGIDLQYYTMIQVIKDMEHVRKTLGFQKINLISESYGTRVAQIYAYEHPDVIHRSVMVGVNPPGYFVWEPSIIDEQIHQLKDMCEAHPECQKETDDLARTFRTVTHNMPSSWGPFPIDRGKVLFLAMNLLHNRDSASSVIGAFLAAEQGDYSGLALLSLGYNIQIKYGDPQPIGDLLSKGIVDYDPRRNYSSDLAVENSIIGSVMSDLLMAAGPVWPEAPFPARYRSPQPTQVETLMVNGSVDFSTPYQNAKRELLPLYENGHLVVLEGLGHVNDVFGNQPEAFAHLATTFFKQGVVDASKFEDRGLAFNTGPNLPAIMKIGLLAVTLLVTLLLGVIYWIYRRVRQRRLALTSQANT